MRFVDPWLKAYPPSHWARLSVELAGRLRKSDLDEIAASSGGDPAEVLTTSLILSHRAWGLFDQDGQIQALWGVGHSPDLPWAGSAWLLGSPYLTHPKNTRFVLEETRRSVPEMARGYGYLFADVDERNTASKRWLKWAGFHPTVTFSRYGAGGLPFTRYVRPPNV